MWGQQGGIVPRTAAERRAAAASGQLRRTGRAVLTAVRSQLTICHACSSNVCRQLETNSYCLVWHMINERMGGYAGADREAEAGPRQEAGG